MPKSNYIDPQTWLADAFALFPDYKINRIVNLLP
jgi:hypothetical protein